MIRRLQHSRNGTVLVLDSALLCELGLDQETEIELTVKDGGLFLSAVETAAEEGQRYHDALGRIASDRRAVLRRLAD